MVQVFEAIRSIFIPATGGHPKNSEYRIAWGKEKWGNTKHDVTKVQMSYNGNIAGMLSPSFPDGTLDERAVTFALQLLKSPIYGTNSRMSKDVLVLRKVGSADNINAVVSKIIDELTAMTIDIFDSKKNPLSVIARVEPKSQFNLDDSTFAFLFRVDVFPS
ncbi:hypothetical protein [Sporolactobacillus laevolacticus]|uniref:hypothetical protein n=1 Tax=Sporolactobacillus laevolacticus TaxID=33018 RepID=UPI0025B58839|nr:hypothetical protein [Sporolactobacillus laevolacticus]MDN3956523.1 hypothetical protein [Sporolactobacillus laevolacticus]